MKYPSQDGQRYRQLRRMLHLIFMLSKRGYTVYQLKKRFNVSSKTIRRDLSAIQEVGIPVYIELIYDDDREKDLGGQIRAYKVDHRWADQFLKRKLK